MNIEADISPIIQKKKPRKIHIYKKADWEGLHGHMAKFSDSFVLEHNSLTQTSQQIKRGMPSTETEFNKSIDKRGSCIENNKKEYRYFKTNACTNTSN